jgi:predicted pyridoxine 5'-phosphate oxidase superfamily flavin-nucleotide-binding protein
MGNNPEIQLRFRSVIVLLFLIENKKKLRGLVRQRTIPTEWPPLVGEVSANFSG